MVGLGRILVRCALWRVCRLLHVMHGRYKICQICCSVPRGLWLLDYCPRHFRCETMCMLRRSDHEYKARTCRLPPGWSNTSSIFDHVPSSYVSHYDLRPC